MQTCQDGTLKDFSIVSNELNIDSLTWSIIDVLFKTDLGIMPELTQKDGVDDAECTVIVFCFPFTFHAPRILSVSRGTTRCDAFFLLVGSLAANKRGFEISQMRSEQF